MPENFNIVNKSTFYCNMVLNLYLETSSRISPFAYISILMNTMMKYDKTSVFDVGLSLAWYV